MKHFIGVKIIKATPMTLGEAEKALDHEIHCDHQEDSPGYLVEYDSNYRSWSPKSVFDVAYREITESEMTFLRG